MDNQYSRPFTKLGICSNKHAGKQISYDIWAVALVQAKAVIATMPEGIKEQARRIMQRDFVFTLSFDECLDLIANATNFEGFGTEPQNTKKQVAWLLQDILRGVDPSQPRV